MSKSINWTILERQNSEPAFFDIRRYENQVWTASGAPFTFGETNIQTFADETAATAFYRRAIEEKQIQDFQLLHQGSTAPDAFDYTLFEQALYDGARSAYNAICAEHPDEHMAGFAIYTDGDAMSIVAVATSEEAIKKQQEDNDEDEEEANYLRTEFNEWPYAHDGKLLLAYRMVAFQGAYADEVPFAREQADYVERMFESCIRALERLDKEELFGNGATRENFLLLFGDSGEGTTREVAKRLNPPASFKRFSF